MIAWLIKPVPKIKLKLFQVAKTIHYFSPFTLLYTAAHPPCPHRAVSPCNEFKSKNGDDDDADDRDEETCLAQSASYRSCRNPFFGEPRVRQPLGKSSFAPKISPFCRIPALLRPPLNPPRSSFFYFVEIILWIRRSLSRSKCPLFFLSLLSFALCFQFCTPPFYPSTPNCHSACICESAAASRWKYGHVSYSRILLPRHRLHWGFGSGQKGSMGAEKKGGDDDC